MHNQPPYNMTRTYEMKDDSFLIYYGVRPFEGERVSGDEVVIVRTDDYVLVGIIDGLGHGEAASFIAKKIKTYIQDYHSQPIDMLVKNAHEQFKGSRGAVVGIAKIQNNGDMGFVGLGNISCKIMGKTQEFPLLSKDGALGIRSRTISITKAKIKKGEQLIMYSDGISNKLFRTPHQLPKRGSKELINKIIDNFGKQYDDASLIFLNKINA